MSAGESTVFTLVEAARYMQISRSHLLNLLAGKHCLKRLWHVRLGRRVLIKQEWIDAWMEEEAMALLAPKEGPEYRIPVREFFERARAAQMATIAAEQEDPGQDLPQEPAG